MIRINLFDYRTELQKIQIQRRVLISIAVMLIAVVLVGVNFIDWRMKISVLDAEVTDLESQAQALLPEVNVVRAMKKKEARISQIVEGIVGLRNNQTQPVMLLDDINLNIPNKIWLKKIEQTDKVTLTQKNIPLVFEGGSNDIVEIAGLSMDDQAVARFVEHLEKVNYLKSVVLYKTEQKLIGVIKVREFTIYCHRA
ncbi:MAG: PilN domain-containing protein [Nitrospinales bacterium]